MSDLIKKKARYINKYTLMDIETGEILWYTNTWDEALMASAIINKYRKDGGQIFILPPGYEFT